MITENVEVLTAAALTLRGLARGATPGPWQAHFTVHGYPLVIADPGRPSLTTVATVSTAPADSGRANNHFIAAMDPGLALVLADWLDEEAARARTGETSAQALAVARNVNGVNTAGTAHPKPTRPGR